MIEPTTKFRSDIQGLRAIAVCAVVLYHAGVPFIPGGYIGVDIFFVISGFLITSHLLTSLRRDGKVHFASFYAKRVRRILPASLVVLAFSVAAALIWYPPLMMREVWRGALATAFYVPNMLFAAQGTNYLAETTPSLFQHYWSLGIEEQFYLVWPVFLALGLLLVKRPKALVALVAGIVVLSFLACVLLTFRSPPWAFFALPTRGWELGVGGLASFVLTYRPKLLAGPVAAVVGWAGLLALVGSTFLFTSGTQFPGYWAAVPVLATAAVIIAGDSRPRHSPYAVLSVRGMRFVGMISYSLYLVHWPLLQVPQAAVGFGNPLPLWATLMIGAISFPIAWVMYKYVEEPGRTAPWLAVARPRRSLMVAGAASILVAVSATGVYGYSNARLLDAGESAPATVLSVPPSFTSFVPSNLTPSLRAASDDLPVIYADGCHLDFLETDTDGCIYGDPGAPRIALFGDSHAAQWFPALLGFAETNGYSIANYTKSSCPSVSAAVLRNGVPYTPCTQWRDAVVERLNDDPPELVVLSNYGTSTLQDASGDYAVAWEDALAMTIKKITAPVVVLADTPNFGYTPSICLSANLTAAESCGRPRRVALGADTRASEARASEQLGVKYVDLNDYLCTAELCLPILGDTLAYRDAHHLTAAFSALLAAPLGEAIQPSLRSLVR